MTTEATTWNGDGFPLLRPQVQEQLYRMSWQELRPIQHDAIRHVIQGTGHLIISAPTAGGKTEAAFLPILSQILPEADEGVRAVYVSPLKALINDQFRRLEELFQLSGVAVHKWHGDVTASAKKHLREKPSGVLLITPESLESLFINHADRLDRMFGRLAFLVIDELHSFLGTERGAHLHSLLHRLVRRSQLPVRVLALSATFGEDDGLTAARRWLSLGAQQEVRVVSEKTTGKGFRYQVRGYLRETREEKPAEPAAEPNLPVPAPEVTADDKQLAKDLFEIFHSKTCLVFANNKSQLEFYADLLTRHTERLGFANPFRVHHGSLSKAEREETEAALRSRLPTVAFCSSTLELGIDVGAIERVGQIGAPWSVASLTQRLGRSGRGENDLSEIRLFIQEDEPGVDTSVVDRLFPSLLQAVAMSELLLAGWSEPPSCHRLHASTLVQQILSLIAERGGARADSLFAALVQHGAFRTVEQSFFVAALRSMGEADLIEQTASGDLILGLAGERVVRSKDFYVAFRTAEEFTVVHLGARIGSVAVLPSTDIDEFLILAGRRWRVLNVDADRKMIQVEPASGGRLPKFLASGGPDIHPHVRAKMQELLLNEHVPVYLDAKAREMLSAARQAAYAAGLDRRTLLVEGRDLFWFTWTGTRIQRTLLTYARHLAGLKVRDEHVALAFEDVPVHQVQQVFRRMLEQPPAPEAVAALVPNKMQEKYEPLLSNSLQEVVFGHNSLDLDGARQVVECFLGNAKEPLNPSQLLP
jgi:ATP-dependent Lhr-like helicase